MMQLINIRPRPTGSHMGESSNLMLAKYLNTEGPQKVRPKKTVHPLIGTSHSLEIV